MPPDDAPLLLQNAEQANNGAPDAMLAAVAEVDDTISDGAADI